MCNRLLKECQRLASRLDGTESDIGYKGNAGVLGTGVVSLTYHPKTQGWRATADWGYGCYIMTPIGDYPKDAVRGLLHALKSRVKALKKATS